MYERFKEFFTNTKMFSMKFASTIFYSRFLPRERKYALQRSTIYKYLKGRIYDSLMKQGMEYDPSGTNDSYKSDDNSIVWVFWWQGYDKMPEIVKICYTQLLKHTKDYTVHLITKDNISDFVQIPDYIYRKLYSGKMTLTHFSDILRIYLLYEYGGLWCDATIYTHKHISPSIFEKALCCISIDYNGMYISEGRWSCFFLAAKRKSPLIRYLKDFFDVYWRLFDSLIDYLCIDYAIAIIVNENKGIRSTIADGALHLPSLYKLQNSLNFPITLNMKSYISEYSFSKLSWKCDYTDFDKAGNPTVFKYLKEISKV